MVCERQEQHTLWKVGTQELNLDFEGGVIVSDAGLLAVRALERPLRIITGLADLFPDPRAPEYRTHSTEALLNQQVYALLAGYPDHNDHDDIRHDALFKILAELSPDPERPLASGSTLARFQYAFTRRQAEMPIEERPVLLEVRLRSERLSSQGFCANALRLVIHALAYAIVVLLREANAGVPEVAVASVGSLRQRLWKVGAVVVTSARRVWFHLSSSWPYQGVWERVLKSVQSYVSRWEAGPRTTPCVVPSLPM